MTYDVSTIEEYIKALPEERQLVISRLRDLINKNIPPGFDEILQYKLPSWVVPLSRYPAGYHCTPNTPLPFLSIASQKNFVAFYHGGIYTEPDLLNWFLEQYGSLNIGKPDMGKSCIRFKKIEKIPYELLTELVTKITVDQWINIYEMGRKEKRS